MLQRQTLFLLTLTLAILTTLHPFPSHADENGWTLTIVSQTADSLIVELTLTDYEPHDGQFALAGWYNNAQGLPQHTVLLGLPREELPKVEILATEQKILSNIWLKPDADSCFDCTPLAQVDSLGWFGQQAVARLHVAPFRYDATQQQLTVYNRLQIKISMPIGAIQSKPSPTFRPLLENSLFNYEQTRLWSQPLIPPKGGFALGGTERHTPRANTPRLKITIPQTGLYQLTYADISAVAPSFLSHDPRQLRLTMQGQTIPMLFQGEIDGSFDVGDLLLFYGEGAVTDYTNENIYWLETIDFASLRLDQHDVFPTNQNISSFFRQTSHHEQNNQFRQYIPNGEQADHWLWQRLDSSASTPLVSATYPFTLSNLSAQSTPAQLRVMLQGVSYGQHTSQISLNGTPLLSADQQAWSGMTQQLFEVSFDPNLLQVGLNQFILENSLPAGESSSGFYLNWFEVDYDQPYIAEANRLFFNSSTQTSPTSFLITNFDSPDIDLLDVTSPTMPIVLINHVATSSGSSYQLSFSLSFNDNSTTTKQYLAQTVGQRLTPQIELITPTEWQSPEHGASYLIISYPDFYDAVQPLADYRRAQGETVVVVKTDDLYDEFNEGIYHPQAMRDFIAYSYANWSPQPQYLLLVGDASFDPNNFMGDSLSDFLPAPYTDTPLLGRTSNDSWYAQVNGDDPYPDLIMGRITARTPADVTAVIDKVKTYEQTPPDGPWRRRAILVADDDEPTFANDMDQLADLLGNAYNPQKLYDGNSIYVVRDAVNEGAMFLAYSGHGNVGVWGEWNDQYRIFNRGRAVELQNGNKLPFMTVVNCLNGAFADRTRPRTLAEEMVLQPNKGSIAALATAGYGYPAPNSIMQETLYSRIISDPNLSLGGAVTGSIIDSITQRPDFPSSVFETFTYFGDPAVRLNLPPTLALTGTVTPEKLVTGQQADYQFAYSASGRVGASAELQIISNLPTGMQYQTASPPPSRIKGQTLIWELGAVTLNQTDTITMRAIVSSNGLLEGEQLQNQTMLTDTSGGQVDLVLENTVFPTNSAPQASFSSSSPDLLGTATTFRSTSIGTNLDYLWVFGDQTPAINSSDPTIEHTYSAIGCYSVGLTAANLAGQDTITDTVCVYQPPLATFTASGLWPNSPILLDNSSNLGGDESSNGRYIWDFGDGQQSDMENPIHSYAQNGQYLVSLTVFNSVTQSTVTEWLTISDQPIEGLRVLYNPVTSLGQATTFLASQDSGTNINYVWQFEAAQTATEPFVQYEFQTAGVYTVILTASNGAGLISVSVPVTIEDNSPVAVFSSSSPDTLGQQSIFYDNSSGQALQYAWDFGDQTRPLVGSNLTEVKHTYQQSGTYRVVLTVSNGLGHNVTSQTVEIVPDVRPPIAGFTTNQATYQLSQTVQFVNISQDGGDTPDQISYLWNLGDGTITSTVSPSHTYTAIGDYRVWLTITNQITVSSISHTIIITEEQINRPTIGHNTPAIVGQPVMFTGTIAGGSHVNYAWNFDDGTSSTGATSSHVYDLLGQYVVTLTVSNLAGQETVTTMINVVDAPIQGLAISSTMPISHHVLLNETIDLTAMFTAGTNVQFSWNLGNGITRTEQSVSHSFDKVGDYTIILKASNGQGSQIVALPVTVQDVPLIGLNLNVLTNTLTLGDTAHLTATLSAGSGVSYIWNLGDGNHATGPTVSHIYTEPGVYTVTLTASNSVGSKTSQVVLEVIAVIPLMKRYLPVLMRQN
ncbi:PKD domain-containing protein [Anaerolineales bacterium HSG24]|nr:PKD domain-containing protein [Anaerolineales bacterium HSG24]